MMMEILVTGPGTGALAKIQRDAVKRDYLCVKTPNE